MRVTEADIDERNNPAPMTASDGLSERQFVLPWLCSAAVVSVIRLLHAADLGYDLTFQLQAAQHLTAGKGLTVYWPSSDELADPFTLATLTHFPAGYSLFAAALLVTGMDAGMAVKILGVLATMVGWWGWAKVAFIYMGDGARGPWRFVFYWVAIVSPLLFTAPWGGTDIFLWASVPWVLRLVTRPTHSGDEARLWQDGLAGALAGLCVLTRYAALYLAAYAALIVAGQYRHRVALTARRLIVFAAGVLPALAVQAYINYFVAIEEAAPGGVRMSRERLVKAWETIVTLDGANNGPLFWLPDRARVLWTEGGSEWIALPLALAILVAPTLMMMARHRQHLSRWCSDLRATSAGLLIVLPLFLWTSGVFAGYAFVRGPRHYWSIRPLAVCIAFFLATTAFPVRRTVGALCLRYASRAYIVVFLLVTAANAALILAPTERGNVRRQMVLGTSQLRPWPSLKVNYEFSVARAFVLGLMDADPNSILITDLPQWFYADPEVDRARILRWEPCSLLRPEYVSGPARLLMFVTGSEGPLDELRWPGSRDPNQPPECLEQLPRLRLIQHFPAENLRVFEADVPAGVRVNLKPEPSHDQGSRSVNPPPHETRTRAGEWPIVPD
jgi:hypothetical protein